MAVVSKARWRRDVALFPACFLLYLFSRFFSKAVSPPSAWSVISVGSLLSGEPRLQTHKSSLARVCVGVLMCPWVFVFICTVCV